MNARLPRRIGSLFAFLVMTGCAMPPGPANQTSGAPLGTKDARTASAGTPQSSGTTTTFGDRSADAGKSLADAQALGDKGPDVSDFRQTGRASWYGRFFHGRKTANGERYDMHALTAAHKTLPLGSYVRVTNPATSRSVVVRINDRGPFVRSRVIDLSYAAASALDMQHVGTARVRIEGLSPQQARAALSDETLAMNASSSEK
ncbi:septal ring lytic transglycosylase RlpA family protein [Paraburkholderia sp. GAS334]|uniref:septal ring lytic transglycosylase RlpA family protein n=1 Tax=unclassified Paraburkholderia TaxID=2615204 RepID=UPI003D197FB5